MINSKNNYNKYNKNTFSNSNKDLMLWNKGFSGLTPNKYKQMKNNMNRISINSSSSSPVVLRKTENSRRTR